MKFEKKSTLIIGGIAGVCVIGAAVTGFALNSGRNNVNPDKDAINVLTQETTVNISKNETINSSINASETATNISEQNSEELESTSEEVIEETIEETHSSENYEEPQTKKTIVEENNNNYYSNNEESENDNNTSDDNDYSEPENNYDDDNNYSDNSSDYEEPETEAKTEEVLEDHLVYHDDGSLNLQESYIYSNNVKSFADKIYKTNECIDFLKSNDLYGYSTLGGGCGRGKNSKIYAKNIAYYIYNAKYEEVDFGFDGYNFYLK